MGVQLDRAIFGFPIDQSSLVPTCLARVLRSVYCLGLLIELTHSSQHLGFQLP